MLKSPKQWRQDSKLSMAKAAAIAGVGGKNPARTWQRWETGLLEPPLRVISAIEEASGGLVTINSWRAISVASIPASDDTGDRIAGSSLDPIPEKSESLAPVRGADDRVVMPADTGQ